MNCEIHKTLKIDKNLSLWTGCNEGDAYNVICMEQDGVFNYYLQKVGYGDLMHIVGTLEKIALSDDYILDSITAAKDEKFWRD